jgi:hypothetical protein
VLLDIDAAAVADALVESVTAFGTKN